MVGSLTTIARRFDFVRETQGANVGLWVNLFQRFTFNTDGDSWCCSFVCYCLDILFKGKSPLKKSGACQDIYRQAQAKGWIIPLADAQLDDVYLFVNDNDHAHHIGVVTGVGVGTTNAGKLYGIAGNTSKDGLSSNGDGVYEHELNVKPEHIRIIRLPR